MLSNSRFLHLALITSILFCSNLFAQNSVTDSLLLKLEVAKEDTNKVMLLNELCWELSSEHLDSAINYGKSAIRLSTKLDYLSGKSVGLYYLGSIYVTKGETELALTQTKRALAIDQKVQNQSAIASDHNQLGTCYKLLGRFDKAMFHFFKSIDIHENLGNTYYASQIKLNIANFMLDISENAKAVKMAEEAKVVFENYDDKIMTALALEMMAMASKAMEKRKKAISLFEKAKVIFQNEGNKQREAELLNNMGITYHEMDDLDKALYYLNASLEMEDSLGRKYYQAVSNANLALLYIDMDEPEQSMVHLNKAIALGSEIGKLTDVMYLFDYASEVYYENGSYQKAYDNLLVSQQMRDTIFSEKKTELILGIKEQYETKKKIKEIATLKKERDLSQSKAKLVDAVIIISIGSGLLLLIIVYFFFRNRKIREERKKVELEQKVLRAQMNPHFIFNSLNSIQRIFIEGDEDLANDYISDFGKLLRIIMENNGKDFVSIKQEVETLKLYLDIEMIRLDGKIDYEFDIDPNLDLLNNFIPPLIIQPFIENAIWHGILPQETNKKGEIHIEIKRESEKHITCSILDNGIGISKSLAMKNNHSHESKGMSITQERLGTKIIAEDVDSGGTKITLQIPLHK